MPYTRNYQTIIPLAEGEDVEVLRWLTRESFDRTAGNVGLTIVEYSETVVPHDELPPKAAEHLAGKIEDYTWYRFDGLGTAAEESIDWLVAESSWRNEVADAQSA
jgi:hypothetical protein